MHISSNTLATLRAEAGATEFMVRLHRVRGGDVDELVTGEPEELAKADVTIGHDGYLSVPYETLVRSWWAVHHTAVSTIDDFIALLRVHTGVTVHFVVVNLGDEDYDEIAGLCRAFADRVTIASADEQELAKASAHGLQTERLPPPDTPGAERHSHAA
jgi:hypothetical protein